YFPLSTTVDFDPYGSSCSSFSGYHSSAVTSDGRNFAYAVIDMCAVGSPDVSDLEWQQGTLAHELIEAATDASPLTDPGISFPDMGPPPSPWADVSGELADMCDQRMGPRSVIRESGFVAVLVWSNAAARAGDRDPCVPNDGTQPYWAVSITPDGVVP